MELILLITAHLESTDIASLIRTCRRPMALIFLPILYEHINMPIQRRDQVWILMQTLANRPDLAKHMASFKGYLCHIWYRPGQQPTLLIRLATSLRLWRPEKGSPRDIIASQKAFKKDLARAVANMVNLRSLTFPSIICGLRARDLMLQVIIPRLRDRLETVKIWPQGWSPSWVPNAFQVESERLQFIAMLSTQSNIQTLSIPCGILQDFDWEKFNGMFHMPRLMSLTCGWGAACVLGKGRLIQTLGLMDYPFRPIHGGGTNAAIKKDWDELAMSFPSLVALTLHNVNTGFCKYALRCLAPKLGSLELLELGDVSHRSCDIVSP